MSGFTGSFDANQFAPRQGGQAHPVGKYPFTIAHTECVATKDNNGGMLVVTFKSDAGEIQNRYNLWNQSAKAVEIAHGQLSALCHATGVFKLSWENEGAALRGARGMMEIGYQKGEEPTPEKPAGGYVELKKVFDVNGNEPGRAPAAAPQPQPGNGAPMQQNGNGGWGAPPQQQAPNQGPQTQAPWPGPNPQQPQNMGGWQPGPANGAAPSNGPPWANK